MTSHVIHACATMLLAGGVLAITADATAVEKLAENAAEKSVAKETKPTAASADNKSDDSAPQILYRARLARAGWDDFPGFTAKIVVRRGALERAGKLTVDYAGDLKFEGFDGFELGNVERSLKSLVMHRLSASADESKTAKYATADDHHHPLGRSIDLGDRMKSTYRIQGDVIREVNRNMGKVRFTTTVIEVYRNPEGKTLPAFYTVSFWDNENNKLKSSTLNRDRWVRVGNFDLPASVLQVASSDDKTDVVEIEFSNHQLTAAKSAAK